MKIDGDLTSHDRAGDFLEADHVRLCLHDGELGGQMVLVLAPLLRQRSVALTRSIERAKLQNALR